MKELFLDVLKGLFLGMCFVAIFFVIASVSRSAYSNTVHPHDELALTGYNYEGAHSPHWAFFVRNISMRPHRYVELGRDTFGCAGFLCSQSVNLLRLHTNHLTVVCEAPIYKATHSHA